MKYTIILSKCFNTPTILLTVGKGKLLCETKHLAVNCKVNLCGTLKRPYGVP